MTECDTNGCTVDVGQGEQNILRFVDAIEEDEGLELLGTNADRVTDDADGRVHEPDNLFVLKDKRFEPVGSEIFPKIEVKEIMEKCTTAERVRQMIEVLKGEESGIKLEGVTRIVGYYSRTHSWNKSKVGELRDRGKGGYKLKGGETGNQERQNAISNL